MTIKILNLYAGIGGNRKLWGGDIEVVAVEIDKDIAKIYQDFFPNDKVIVGDAHQYLLEHYKEFDFIWSSPPCPSHSQMRRRVSIERGQSKPIFPDMKLYEEIIFLESYFEGKYVVENVISYYEPLIKPYLVGSHYFWANFPLVNVSKLDDTGRGKMGEVGETLEFMQKFKGFDLSKYSNIDKRLLLRNCVESHIAKHIFNLAFKNQQKILFEKVIGVKGG